MTTHEKYVMIVKAIPLGGIAVSDQYVVNFEKNIGRMK